MTWDPAGSWFFTRELSPFGYTRGSILANIKGETIPVTNERMGNGSHWSPDGSTIIVGSQISALVHISWKKEIPVVDSVSTIRSNYSDGWGMCFSPDGNYFIWAMEKYDDRGNDISSLELQLTDIGFKRTTTLTGRDGSMERPISWTSDNILITRNDNHLFCYSLNRATPGR